MGAFLKEYAVLKDLEDRFYSIKKLAVKHNVSTRTIRRYLHDFRKLKLPLINKQEGQCLDELYAVRKEWT